MTEHTPTPKLVMGHIVCFGFNDEEGIAPSDEAVIHLAGDEDSEIEVKCPDAPRLASLIVKAVNNHEALIDALKLFADPASWRLSGSCDPNSGAFRGLQIAQGIISRVERGEQP